MCDFLGMPTVQRLEEEARRMYPEAAHCIDIIVRVNRLCEDGKRIAWGSARTIQNAIDKVRGTPIDAPELARAFL